MALFSGGHRLVLPLYRQLAAGSNAGHGVCPGSDQRGAGEGKAGDHEQRPGKPFHESPIHGTAKGRRRSDQYGREGTGAG